MPSDPFIGDISIFAGNYAPEGWMLCNGQELPIAQYQALFAIIGITYGGNGQTTFRLPDLRGRVPLHQNPPSYGIGQSGGQASVNLTVSQLPAHNHPVFGSASGSSATPKGCVPGSVEEHSQWAAAPASDCQLHAQTVGNTGSGAAVDVRQPWLAVNFIIAFNGIFPPRP